MAHKKTDGIEVVDLAKESDHVRFSVTELSPFALLWVDDSETVIPPEVLPPGVDPNDVKLIIEPLADDKTAAMQADMEATSDFAIKEFVSRRIWKKYAEWWEIRLVNIKTGEDVPLQGDLTIKLPYPSGTYKDNSFLMVHKINNGLERVALSQNDSVLSFTVNKLSPFALLWLDKSEEGLIKPSGDRDYSTYSGDNGSPDTPYEFWEWVKKSILLSKRGDTVKVRTPALILTCPS
jgi:hypothetical protein